MTIEQDDRKKEILIKLTKNLDNVHVFAKEQNVISKFHMIDFWEKWDGVFRKEGEGDFYTFAVGLFNLANERASDTIKLYFDHKDYPIDYDLKEPSHALYILAKGLFNGQEYFVKATSEHKYHNENYIFEKNTHRV